MYKKYVVSALFTALALSAAVEIPLTNPAAPFAKKKTVSEKQSKPYFDAKGKRIIFGTKTIQVLQNGCVVFMESGRQTSYIYMYGKTPHVSYVDNQKAVNRLPYKHRKNIGVDSVTADEKNKTITVKGHLFYGSVAKDELRGDYTLTVALLENNKVKVRLENFVPQNLKQSFITMFWRIPGAKGFRFGDKEQSFPKKGWKMWRNRGEEIFVHAARPEDDIRISNLKMTYLFSVPPHNFSLTRIDDKKNPGRSFAEMDIDLVSWSGKADTGAIDLKKVEDLEAEKPASRNMIPNPYLARGLNYIGTWVNATIWRAFDMVTLSKEKPLFGEYCLRVDQSLDYCVDVSAVSVAPGVYTASLYARSDTPGARIILQAGGHNWGRRYALGGYEKVSKNWKRHKITIKVPTLSMLRLRFSCKAAPGTVVYFDGLQLEKGSKATEFDANPASAQLLTSAAGDFIRSGDRINARLRLSTLKPRVSGKLNVTVSDAFGNKLASRQAAFDFKKSEHPEIDLDLDGKIPDGVHVVRTEFEVDGKKYTEFSRFSVMPFFSNKHKLKNFFSTRYCGYCSYQQLEPGFEKNIRRLMHLGSGCNPHQMYSTPELDALYKKYNFEVLNSGVIGRTGNLKHLRRVFPWAKPEEGHIYYQMHFTDDRYEYLHDAKGGLVLDHRLSGGWTPEFRKKVVDTASYIVKKSPPRRIYVMGTEWPAEIKNDPHYIDLLLAVREGIKRVYPNSLFGEGGAANMHIGSGVMEVDQMLTRLKGRMPIEIVHIHPYTLNVYDTEKAFKAFIDVVENKHGYKNMKYFFGEGMHYGPYQVLEWGLDSINWMGEGWASGSPLSYDIGWYELRNSAFFMRTWLIFMTKFKQIYTVNSSMANYAGNFDLDVEQRPRLFQKVPNTLSMLFGNMERFVKDVSFAKNCKSLIFEDEKGRPVVAVWSTIPDVDNGFKQGPMAKADIPADVEIFDMNGARRTPRKDGMFPVSAFPHFFRGKPGEVDRYVKIFANAEIPGDNSMPFETGFAVISRNQGELTLTNPKARPVAAEVTIGGKVHKISVAPQKKFIAKVPFVPAINDRRIVESSAVYTVKSGNAVIKNTERFRSLAIRRFTGDWNKIPAIRLERCSRTQTRSAKDFSATAQTAWDEKNLYVRVNVTDDRFVHDEKLIGLRRWNNDSLQIFIDTRCSARKMGRTKFDEDDYVYNIYPAADGKSARVFRWRSPDMQLTMGTAAPKDKTYADDIPCKFTRTANGYIYEVTIPAKYMLPARLEANYIMGLAVFVNDRDEKKVMDFSLTSTPQGTAPYDRPHLYPQVLLSE